MDRREPGPGVRKTETRSIEVTRIQVEESQVTMCRLDRVRYIWAASIRIFLSFFFSWTCDGRGSRHPPPSTESNEGGEFKRYFLTFAFPPSPHFIFSLFNSYTCNKDDLYMCMVEVSFFFFFLSY